MSRVLLRRILGMVWFRRSKAVARRLRRAEVAIRSAYDVGALDLQARRVLKIAEERNTESAKPEARSRAPVASEAVADPRVSVWGIAAAAVLDHTPAGQPAHEQARAAGIAVHDYLRGLRELVAAGHLSPGSSKVQGRVIHGGAEAHLAPLVDGRWAYRLTIHHHTGPTPHEHVAGIVDTIADLVSAHTDRCCPITAIHDRFRPQTQSRIARAATRSLDTITAGEGVDVLAASVDHRVIVPDHCRDPRLVATDASVDNTTGVVTWAVVTGAGWVRTGHFPSDLTCGGRALLGELRAAIEALRTYRPGTVLTLLSDNTSIVDLLTLARTRPRKRMPKALNGEWLAEYRDQLLGLVGERTVSPHWRRRNHPMIVLADALTRSNAPLNVTITHTSSCGPDDLDHTDCPGGWHACSDSPPPEDGTRTAALNVLGTVP